jgi:hypothetical protein
VFAVPFGPAHPVHTQRKSPRVRAAEFTRRASMHGQDGVPHHAVLAKPR